MLYEIHADMGRTEDVDLDGDGIPETRRPEIKIFTVEAGSGDEAAALAMTMGAKFVRGVAPSSQQRANEPASPDESADLTAAAADEPIVPASAVTDLLAKADGMHVKTLRAAASKILGDDVPDTKAEIIAALHAKAA